MKTDQQRVEMQIVADCAYPIAEAHRRLVLFERGPNFVKNFRGGLVSSQHSSDFEDAADIVNLLDILARKLRHGNSTVNIAPKQAFQRKDPHGLPPGLAGHSQRSGEGDFLQ